MLEASTVYFAGPGQENTPRVIECATARLGQGGLTHVVVASGSGKTAVSCQKAFASVGLPLVCVTHHVGFHAADEFELDSACAAALRKARVPIVTGTHALSGVSRSISSTFGGTTSVEVIAHTLRLLGQGTKVCVEIAVMAADAGAIPTDHDVLAIAGTRGGADTAVVLRPAHMNRFFDLRIREILCKPRDW
jgi:hypothetical protein